MFRPIDVDVTSNVLNSFMVSARFVLVPNIERYPADEFDDPKNR